MTHLKKPPPCQDHLILSKDIITYQATEKEKMKHVDLPFDNTLNYVPKTYRDLNHCVLTSDQLCDPTHLSKT